MYFRRLLLLGFAPVSSTVNPVYRSSRLEDVCRVFMPWEKTPSKAKGDNAAFDAGYASHGRRSADLTARAAFHGVFR